MRLKPAGIIIIVIVIAILAFFALKPKFSGSATENSPISANDNKTWDSDSTKTTTTNESASSKPNTEEREFN